eukprot:5758181-Pyramimonas_sp.AAC.1
MSFSSTTGCCQNRRLLSSHALHTVTEVMLAGSSFATTISLSCATDHCRCQRLLLSHAHESAVGEDVGPQLHDHPLARRRHQLPPATPAFLARPAQDA